MILDMSKLEIIGERGDFDKIVNQIYDAGVLHVETLADLLEDPEVGLSEIRLTPEQKQHKDLVEAVHAKIKSLLLLLPPDKSKIETFTVQPPLDLLELETQRLPELETLTDEVTSLVAQRNELAEKLTILEQYNLVFQALAPVVADVEAMEQHQVIGLTIEKKLAPKTLQQLQSDLQTLTAGEYHLETKDVSPDLVGVVLVVNRSVSKELDSLMATADLHQIRMPSVMAEMPFHLALQELIAMRDGLPSQLTAVNLSLNAVSQRWLPSLKKLQMAVEDQLNLFKTMEGFGQTSYTFMIRGWLPTKHVSGLVKKLTASSEDRLIINVLKVTKAEEEGVPVCQVHSPLVRPFKQVMSIFPLPKYTAIDPTALLAIGFPLFFGAMLGDIGYGLIFLGVALYLKRKYKTSAALQDVSFMLIWCSISSIIFGALYGEFFGDFAHKYLGLKPLWEDRLKAIIPLMAFSIGVGVFHIFLGLILGVVESIRERAPKHGIGKAATLATIVALIFLIGQLAAFLPKGFFTGGTILLIIAIPLLIYAEGWIGLLEIVSTIGNILSYARLMAIGLSSAIIAMVANYFGGVIGNVVLAAIVVLLLHALNLALGIYSPTIQGLRLHYVEFFKQFFRYGGRIYTPFARTNAAIKL